jgi:hypothetical protein
MLDSTTFNTEFLESIAPHFGIDISTEQAMFRYYKAFSHISDSRFIQVMETAFIECDRRTFSVPWVLNRAVELANREALAELPALQSAEQSELDRLTEEELAINRKRLAVMMCGLGMKSAKPAEALPC